MAWSLKFSPSEGALSISKVFGGTFWWTRRPVIRLIAASAVGGLISILPLGSCLAENLSGEADKTADSAAAAKPSEDPIYPVWKLLNHEQKSQYVAGYVQGWKDASKVTDIAIDFVKQNPDEAVSGLEKLRALYDLSDVSPSLLVGQLDRFFNNSDNREASLSYAISAARSGSQ